MTSRLRLLVTLAVLAGIGTGLLLLPWMTTQPISFVDALFTSTSAAAVTGLSVLTTSTAFTWLGQWVILLLMQLGGLGIPVYMELLYRRTTRQEGRRLRRLSLQTRLVLWSALILILVGWAGLLLGEYRQEGVLSGVSFGERVLRAWFQSVAARTAGFAGLNDFANLHDSSRLLLICLMFIGSAPASMGGGITTGTFSVLMVAMWSLARGYDRVHIGQRAISMAVVWRAITILFISLGVVLSATWLLLVTQELSLSQALFEVVSAFSTTGLSLGITGQLDTFGRLVIIGLMFWGRLGAITIMLILLKRSGHDTLLQYPEETVLVG
jgi:trk system potassium uptake protein TrkH